MEKPMVYMSLSGPRPIKGSNFTDCTSPVAPQFVLHLLRQWGSSLPSFLASPPNLTSEDALVVPLSITSPLWELTPLAIASLHGPALSSLSPSPPEPLSRSICDPSLRLLFAIPASISGIPWIYPLRDLLLPISLVEWID